MDPVSAAGMAAKKAATRTVRRVGSATVGMSGQKKPPNGRKGRWVVPVVALTMLAWFAVMSLTSAVTTVIGGAGAAAAAGADCGAETGDAVTSPAGPVNVNAAQTRNAKAIIAAAKEKRLTEREMTLGIMVALVETDLLNVASSGNGQEASQKYPNDGVRPPNAQSVGLFQQQPWWGSMKARMTPKVSAGLFYAAMEKVSGWKTMELGALAQRIQGSAYPDRYALREKQARGIVAKVADTVDATADTSAVPAVGDGGDVADDCGSKSFGAMACKRRVDLPADLALRMTPDGVRVLWCGARHAPWVKTIYTIGERPAGTGDDHATGRAVDFMVPDYKSTTGKRRGSELAEWMMKNHAAMGVKYIIWNDRIWNVERDTAPRPLSQWRDYRDPTGTNTDTTMHLDHVHVSVFGNAATSAVQVKGKWTRPMKGGYVLISPFGMRVSPTRGGLRLHAGVDMAVPVGTPVVAATNGTVSNREDPSGYGHYVVLNHAGRTQTLYGHLSRQSHQNGARVKTGQIIGYSGNSGGSTGPHLHFEVRKNANPTGLGTPLDPVPYMASIGLPLECAPNVTVSMPMSKKGNC